MARGRGLGVCSCAANDCAPALRAVLAAVPALAELPGDLLAAFAAPIRPRGRCLEKKLLGGSEVRLAQKPQLRLAFSRRQVAHGGRQEFVLHDRTDSGGRQHILRMMHGGEIPGAVDALQSLERASHFAAQMKSFSERPPMAWVAYSTRHLL